MIFIISVHIFKSAQYHCFIYSNLWYNLCNLSLCVISKRRSSIGQTLIKVKYKLKWMVKVIKTWKLPSTTPSSHVDSFLHMVFAFFVNILKKIFQQTKIWLFKECPIFLYLIFRRLLKFTRPSLRLVVLIKGLTSFYCNVCS